MNFWIVLASNLAAVAIGIAIGSRGMFERGRQYEAWLRNKRAEEVVLAGVEDIRKARAIRELADG